LLIREEEEKEGEGLLGDVVYAPLKDFEVLVQAITTRLLFDLVVWVYERR
jgi:hypothetical protein